MTNSMTCIAAHQPLGAGIARHPVGEQAFPVGKAAHRVCRVVAAAALVLAHAYRVM